MLDLVLQHNLAADKVFVPNFQYKNRKYSKYNIKNLKKQINLK